MSTLLAKIIADFTTSLATEISIGGTTATLQSATDDDAVSLPTGRYFFTLDGANSSKEHISCDLSGTALTNIKTVSRQGTETAGVLRKHRIGATVSITDFAHIFQINNLLNGVTTLNASTPLGYDGTASITTANQIATKAYVDGVAIAGGADASTTVKGITKLSVAPASPTNPIAVGDNDNRVSPVSLATVDAGKVDALAGTSGTPSGTNKYVTNDDVASAATASKVARRNATGDITVPTTPSAGGDAASKTYTDTQVATKVTNPPLGAWVSFTKATNYPATTDLIVTFSVLTDTGSGAVITGLSDSSATPTTVRAKATPTSAGQYLSITFPVKKNDYFNVTAPTAATYVAFQMSIGS